MRENSCEQMNISLEMIPRISKSIKQENVLEKALQVFADGEKAKIFISAPDNDWGFDEKICIIWEKPHKVYEQSFTTKYFDLTTPGKLTWGHDSKVILLQKD